jgi:hypothetical protein
LSLKTDWGIHGGDDPKVEDSPKLKPHRTYKDYGDFELQVDEAHRGIKDDFSGVTREIEFVVKHHPETEEGGKKLKLTMQKLEKEVKVLEQKGTQYYDGFMLRDVIGDKKYYGYFQ